MIYQCLFSFGSSVAEGPKLYWAKEGTDLAPWVGILTSLHAMAISAQKISSTYPVWLILWFTFSDLKLAISQEEMSCGPILRAARVMGKLGLGSSKGHTMVSLPRPLILVELSSGCGCQSPQGASPPCGHSRSSYVH